MSLLKRVLIPSLVGLLLAAPAVWARPAVPSPNVVVTYQHPEKFTEYRTTPVSERTDTNNDLALLKRYMEKRAARALAAGQHLTIVVTDVTFAGQYEPWPNSPTGWMRVIRRTYPPRIDLHFTLTDAQGKVLKQGERKLSNPGFMDTAGIHDSDPIRYEKVLINNWVRRDIAGK